MYKFLFTRKEENQLYSHARSLAHALITRSLHRRRTKSAKICHSHESLRSRTHRIRTPLSLSLSVFFSLYFSSLLLYPPRLGGTREEVKSSRSITLALTVHIDARSRKKLRARRREEGPGGSIIQSKTKTLARRCVSLIRKQQMEDGGSKGGE